VPSQLVVEDLAVVYRRPTDGGPLVALNGVSFTVEAGELVAVVGPSGCGKSSLLLAVNGLLRPARGRLTLEGAPVTGPSPERALVFQESALLPWRTALANVELGLELAGHPAAERRDLSRQYLRLVGLAEFEAYYPHQLSGGMRQRVGLARALAVRPRVLLMDEPFGALDAQTRALMGAELLRLWEADRRTILFVTHDLDEAIYLADRVVVLSARPGRVLDTVRIEMPRPRSLAVRGTPDFGAYRQRLWARLEGEAQRALGVATEDGGGGG
jgi:NitT/TauT family transport system ATP-binding protein